MNMVMAVYKGRLLGYKTFFYESLSTPIGVKLHKGEPVIIYGKNIRRFPIDLIEVLLYRKSSRKPTALAVGMEAY
jgi:hypothetical protein